MKDHSSAGFNTIQNAGGSTNFSESKETFGIHNFDKAGSELQFENKRAHKRNLTLGTEDNLMKHERYGTLVRNASSALGKKRERRMRDATPARQSL
jgi:hypothetical protein